MKRLIYPIACLLLAAAPAPALAQRVVCTARVEATRLTPEQQRELEGLAEAIETYITTYAWTEDIYDYTVDFHIGIFVESLVISGFERTYIARAVISNRYDQRHFDQRWRFVYNRNEVPLHSQVFHSLAGFIDFYVYLILGGEFDSLGSLMGTPYYDKAREIASRGKVSNYREGWTGRIERLDDILSNRRYRLVKGVYADAMALLYDEGKPLEAWKKMDVALTFFEEIFDFNSRDKYTRIFLDAHHEELAAFYAGFGRPEIFERIIAIDPDHEEVYRAFQKRNGMSGGG